jgi:hypothetical protein
MRLWTVEEFRPYVWTKHFASRIRPKCVRGEWVPVWRFLGDCLFVETDKQIAKRFRKRRAELMGQDLSWTRVVKYVREER